LGAENIAYFLDYAQTAFRLFGRRAKYWATFNEPGKAAQPKAVSSHIPTITTCNFRRAGVTSFAGHVYGSFPPGRIGHVAGAARQMLHMFRAHAQVYDIIKAMPGELLHMGFDCI
jgi:beta-glucosidase/6-phospho-beta-glucosidase/beta-galactosidase